MVIEILGVAIGALVPAVGAVVWLVRLEGKINVLSAVQIASDKRIEGLEHRIAAQLDRIETRLDEWMRRP